jgi:hypothetical protein
MGILEDGLQSARAERFAEVLADERWAEQDRPQPTADQDQPPTKPWLRRLGTIVTIVVVVALLVPIVWVLFFA